MAQCEMEGGIVSYLGVDGEWHDLGVAASASITIVPMVEPEMSKPLRFPKPAEYTITLDEQATNALWGVLVGYQLRYALREFHRNLGRSLRWPSTN